jgi:hypothetical protein
VPLRLVPFVKIEFQQFGHGVVDTALEQLRVCGFLLLLTVLIAATEVVVVVEADGSAGMKGETVSQRSRRRQKSKATHNSKC